MNTKIRTNRIEYRIDRELIASRYEFYIIETTEKYIKRGAFILDAQTLNDNIKSICFESGRKAVIMLPRMDGNRSSLKQLLKDTEGGEKLSLSDYRISDIPDYSLLQLMLNALSSYDLDILKFNNLTGHFYCFHPEWIKHGKDKNEDIIWKVPCLELNITKDYCVRNSVRTFTSERLKKKIAFTKRKFEDYPQYIMAKGNTLRRKLTGSTESGFIQRQIEGTKTEIPFLDFQNIKKFNQCKVGVLNNIIDVFNKKYDQMAHIELGFVATSNRIDYSKSGAKEDVTRIRALLVETGVHIVDQISDDYSTVFCDDIKSLMQEKYGVSATSGKRIKKEALNICVIHNVEYYDGIDDPHSKDYSDAAVQHVTLEDFAGNAEFATSTVIHEVLIKKDLMDGKVSLFNWKQLGLDESISFGIEAEIDEINHYYFMKVDPDGSFEIKEQELNLFEINEYSDCVDVFEDAKTKGETVKGIIRDSAGCINIIKDTGIITLPNADEIKQLLEVGDTKLRGKERREELLSSCLDIKTYEENDYLYYYVGTIGEGMRWNIPRAANVRRIEKYKDAPMMFDSLLPTMNVTFVHNGQLTVLPFPFKYLREYVNDIKRRYIIMQEE